MEASLDIVFLDELFRMFAERDVCHHFFMKGQFILCLQGNDCFDHVCFFVWGVFYAGVWSICFIYGGFSSIYFGAVVVCFLCKKRGR